MPEVTVTNQVVVDGHHITADLVIAPTATPGAKTLTVTTPGGSANHPFTVLAGGPPATGLLRWYEADYGLGSYSDGQRITSWPDRALGQDAFPTVAGLLAPTYNTGLFGGRPALNFNADAALQDAIGLQLTTFAIFWVGLISSSVSLQTFYEFSDFAGGFSNAFRTLADTSYIRRPGGADSSFSQPVAPNPITRDARKLWRQQFSGTHASHQVWENGVQRTLLAGNTGNPGTALTTGANRLRFGAIDASNFKVVGYLSALLVYSPIPSASDITAIEGYLTARWPLQ